MEPIKTQLKEMEELGHTKCIIGEYPGSNIMRFTHNNSWDNYSFHQEYTMYDVNNKPVWADDNNIDYQTILNDRFSSPEAQPFLTYNGNPIEYHSSDNRPLNPIGPTGIRGRGQLGKWGPNTAADPLVTRWARNINGEQLYDDNCNRVLEFVAIKRKDTGEWAIPGGMVDPGEALSVTAKREFGEEALNSLLMTEQEKSELKQKLDNFFSNEMVIYQGYVDDPRNTDNAWMVTKCFLWHDDTGEVMNNFKLNAGDDASAVRWARFSPLMKERYYASHGDWINHAYNLLSSRITIL